jgi:type I restriction enzyme S subunit
VGDVLFNRTNSAALVGKTGLVRDLGPEPIVFASYLVRLIVDTDRALPEYVNLVLNSSQARRQFLRLATPGVSQWNINPTVLCTGFQLPLPAKPEQAGIVSTLMSFENSTRLCGRLLDRKVLFKHSLMQQLLTGKLRLPGFSANWQERNLGDLFTERQETDKPSLPLLSITAERGIIPREEVERKDTSTADKSAYLRIVSGDIGYNTMRMWQGVSALSSLEGIVSPAYTVCIPGPEVDGQFASYLFKLPATVHLFRRFSQGLVDDTLNLKFHHFAQIRVVIPPIEEQRAIAGVLSVLDREIRLLERQCEVFALERRVVTEQLLSGDVRIPGAYRGATG